MVATKARTRGKKAGSKYSKVKRARQARKKTSTGGISRIYKEVFPRELRTTLRYHQNISLDPTAENLGAGGANVWVFSGNGCYDPDTTGTGHQPMYFDNLSAVYGRYVVSFSKINVTVINHSVNTSIVGPVNTPNYSYRLGILRENSATDYPSTAGMSSLIEERDPNFVWRYVGPALTGDLPSLQHTQRPTALWSGSLTDDLMSAPTSANAGRPTYFIIGITSSDGTTDPPTVYLSVTIDYWVKFYDRRSDQSQQ